MHATGTCLYMHVHTLAAVYVLIAWVHTAGTPIRSLQVGLMRAGHVAWEGENTLVP